MNVGKKIVLKFYLNFTKKILSAIINKGCDSFEKDFI